MVEKLTSEQDGPKAFIECLIPVTACNLRCSYCYVIQENRRGAKVPKLPYSIERIKESLTRERFGGTCFFNLCGAGETLIPRYTIDIAKALLENGHFINITTNGTLTNRFDQILEEFSSDELERMSCSFSFHYLELVRIKKLDAFFANVRKMRDAGTSVLVQLNLCDEYLPHLDEIKRLCMQEVGAYPQVAATREEEHFPATNVRLLTELSREEYERIGNEFDSPLFRTTMKNFGVKRREFCYNGDWAYVLNFGSGRLHRCYNSALVQDIFKNPAKPIMKCAVGHCCNALFCYNSTHFMSIGTIPESDTPPYVDLRDRPEASWYNDRMKAFLSHKLSENNRPYNALQKVGSRAVGVADTAAYNAYALITRHRQAKEENKGL